MNDTERLIRRRLAGARPGFYVTWCAGECAGNPHKTRAAAEQWIMDAYASAKAAKAQVYGNYAITEIT